jgi:hypothetical protein
MDTLTPIITWAAPIASTIIVTWLTALINRWMDESKKDRQKEADERKAWRAGVDRRLDAQDGKIDTLLDLSCSQNRSDVVHKCHRYLDDLGCASSEEKQALWAQHEDYKKVCDANGIENHFVEQLVQRVMELPERTI